MSRSIGVSLLNCTRRSGEKIRPPGTTAGDGSGIGDAPVSPRAILTGDDLQVNRIGKVRTH